MRNSAGLRLVPKPPPPTSDASSAAPWWTTPAPAANADVTAPACDPGRASTHAPSPRPTPPRRPLVPPTTSREDAAFPTDGDARPRRRRRRSRIHRRVLPGLPIRRDSSSNGARTPSGETKPDGRRSRGGRSTPEANPNGAAREPRGRRGPCDLRRADDRRARTVPRRRRRGGALRRRLRAPDGERAGGGPRGDHAGPRSAATVVAARAEQRGATRGGHAIRWGRTTGPAGRRRSGEGPRKTPPAPVRNDDSKYASSESSASGAWSMFRVPRGGVLYAGGERSGGQEPGTARSSARRRLSRRRRGDAARTAARSAGSPWPPCGPGGRAKAPIAPRRREAAPRRGAATEKSRAGDVGSNGRSRRRRDRRTGRRTRRARRSYARRVARARRPRPRRRPPHAVRRGRDDQLLQRAADRLPRNRGSAFFEPPRVEQASAM